MKGTILTAENLKYHSFYPLARRETNALAKTTNMDALSIDAAPVEYLVSFIVNDEK